MLKIPKDLLDTLLELRAQQLLYPDNPEFFLNNPVVMLTLGLGSKIYLGLDGRVFVLDQANFAAGIHETDDPRFLAGGLRVCAVMNKLPELLALVPPLPEAEAKCPDCDGEGLTVFEWGLEIHTLVCYSCGGLGWQRPL